jgi:hypothetical protein
MQPLIWLLILKGFQPLFQTDLRLQIKSNGNEPKDV